MKQNLDPILETPGRSNFWRSRRRSLLVLVSTLLVGSLIGCSSHEEDQRSAIAWKREMNYRRTLLSKVQKGWNGMYHEKPADHTAKHRKKLF